jgi:hypothetical protein
MFICKMLIVRQRACRVTPARKTTAGHMYFLRWNTKKQMRMRNHEMHGRRDPTVRCRLGWRANKTRCWSCKRARRQEALELQTQHFTSCMHQLHVGCTQPPLQHREHARELLNSTIASRCSTEKLRYCVCAHHGSCNGEVNRCKMTGGLLKRYKQASGEGRRPRAAERAPGADHRGQSSNCRPAKAAARSCRAAAKLSAHCSVI